MAFLAKLERVASAVEGRLDRLLAQNPGKALGNAKFGEAMSYAALGGGKRLRPFLLIKSARCLALRKKTRFPLLARSNASIATPWCMTICLQWTRRRPPRSCHPPYRLRRGDGHPRGRRAADACLRNFKHPETHPEPAIRAELVFLLAKAGGWQGMALGQALDLSPARRGFSAGEIAEMQALKTGALFRFACEAGAVLGRADPSARRRLVAMRQPSAKPSSSPTTCSMRKATRKPSARRWPRTRHAARRRLWRCWGPTPRGRGLRRCCKRPKRPLRPSASGLSPCLKRAICNRGEPQELTGIEHGTAGEADQDAREA